MTEKRTPADELRTAAHILRDRASAAVHEGRTTWSTGNTLGSRSPVVIDDPDTPSVLIETYAARLEAVNRYLALLGPATGHAMADWLDSTAATIEAVIRNHEDAAHEGAHWIAPALAVARAIKGTQEATP